MRWPRTLLCRTTLVIASVSVTFQLFVIGTIAYFALVPLGQRAADDLSALLINVAEEWSALPAAEQADRAAQILHMYDLRIDATAAPLFEFSKRLPYYYFVEEALRRRTGRECVLRSRADETDVQRLWAEIPTVRGVVRVGFSSDRSGVSPPWAFALILIVGALATFATSAFLARRLTAPLRRLSTAVRSVGEGGCPEPLPGGGPEEFDVCVHSFNRMVTQVQSLLASRTTLLAGISHDLRTPLARMRLALGMLSEDYDPDLVQHLMRDVDIMNALIGRCLEVGKGFEESPKPVDISTLLSEVVEVTRRAGRAVEYSASPPRMLRLRSLAFQRVIGNLLDNALRYGGNAAPCVEFDGARLEVRVMDRGQGIPALERENVFRPFYRLEPSRACSTGGSGLGLAIVHQLANANGWRVWIEWRVGGGTVVTVGLAAENKESPVMSSSSLL
ncbi:MAG: HAMP domain-containing protein [Betaproteobacteria bacterium]|nr:MAG: HAMP domain-containing protein [Betaproteobacteria bacterium]